MKNNAKYTALEILKAAEPAFDEAAFGTKPIVIAGIAGITKPDHLIKFQSGIDVIVVQVGDDSQTIKLENNTGEFEVSEIAHKVLEIKGKKSAEAAEKLQAAKKSK